MYAKFAIYYMNIHVFSELKILVFYAKIKAWNRRNF